MDRIKQYRVLGRDNVGRRNKSEEGKNSNAKQRDGYGPGLLFLGKSLRWIGGLELAFQMLLRNVELSFTQVDEGCVFKRSPTERNV